MQPSLRDILPEPRPLEPELEHALGLGEARPWFVQGLLGCGTWIGALIVVVVVTLSLAHPGTKALSLLLAPAFLGGAVALYHARRGILPTQLTFIASLGGIALLSYGLMEVLHLKESQLLWILLAVLALQVAAVPIPVHRFLASAGLAVVGRICLHDVLEGVERLYPLLLLAPPLLAWLFESRLGTSWLARLWRPTAFGLLVAGLVLLGWPEGRPSSPGLDRWLLAAGFTLLALAAAWRILAAQAGSLSPAAVLATWGAALASGALAAFSPGLTAALLLLALGQHRRERLLTGLGLGALAYFLWHFYAGLETSLLAKAAWLALSGLALLAGRLGLGMGLRARPRVGRREGLVLAAAALVLGTVGGLVAGKERLLATGRHVLLELAPRDPRSLMQGDYMRLDYAGLGTLARHQDLPDRGYIVARVDPSGLAVPVRVDDGTPLAPDQVRIRYRRRGWTLSLGAETYFFQEGRAAAFSSARYAELVLSPDGATLLAGLRDKDRARL